MRVGGLRVNAGRNEMRDSGNQTAEGGARLREVTTVRDCAGRNAEKEATIAAGGTSSVAANVAAAAEKGA